LFSIEILQRKEREMTDWYYEDNGTQRGPVSESDLNAMLVNRLLPPSTLVWSEGLGSVWKPASQTHLEAAPQPVRPPPLPTTASPPLLPAAAAGGAPALGRQVTLAPPTVKSPLTEKWAMWLAFSPLFYLAADIILASAGIDPYGHSPQAVGSLFWCGMATLWLAYKDARAINDAGRNPQHRTLVPFLLLFPIGYLIRRRIVAATSLTPLWIWLVGIIVYVMGASALSAQ
jgi:hypothetical protein